MTTLPPSQAILWSKSLKKLDLEKDKIYLVHQILAFGSLKEIPWLFKKFTKREISNIFLNYPQKVYTPASFNFVRKIVLGLKNKLDEKKYLKTPS